MFDDNVIKLKKEQFIEAESVAYLIEDVQKRKLAFANTCTLFAFKNYLEKNNFSDAPVTNINLFRVPAVVEKYEISDLYLGNIRFDVRVSLDGKVFPVPKSHINNSFVADFYVVYKGTKNPLKCEAIGYIRKEDLIFDSQDENYFYISTSILNPLSDLKSELNDFNKEEKVFYETEHKVSQENFGAFLDKNLDAVKSDDLISHLLQCDKCRALFVEFSFLEDVLSGMHHFPDLIEKYSQIQNADQVVEENIQNEFTYEEGENSENGVEYVVEDLEALVQNQPDESISDDISILQDENSLEIDNINDDVLDLSAQTEEIFTQEDPEEQNFEITDFNIEGDEYEITENLEIGDYKEIIEESEQKQDTENLEFSYDDEQNKDEPVDDTQDKYTNLIADAQDLETEIKENVIEEKIQEDNNFEINLDYDDNTGLTYSDDINEVKDSLTNIDETVELNLTEQDIQIDSEALSDNNEQAGVNIDTGDTTAYSDFDSVNNDSVELNLENINIDADAKETLKNDEQLAEILNEQTEPASNWNQIYADNTQIKDVTKQDYDFEDSEDESENQNNEAILSNDDVFVNDEYNDETINNEENIIENVNRETITKIIKNKAKNRNIYNIIVVVLLLAIIAAGGFIYYTKFAKNTGKTSFDTSSIFPGANKQKENGDINQTMTNAFSEQQNDYHISKISWQIDKTLANNENVKQYLMEVGQTLGDSLDMAIPYVPVNTEITDAKILVKLNGTGEINKIKIVESTGSDEMDNVIKENISKTLSSIDIKSYYNISGDIKFIIVLNF